MTKTERGAAGQAEVDEFIKELKHPLKKEIEALRAVILSADKGMTEHVKWNAPSFCYENEDRVTMRLQPGNRLQLIFHRGAKAKDGDDFAFNDPTGLLQWLAKNRAMVTFRDMKDVQAKKAALRRAVSLWVKTAG